METRKAPRPVNHHKLIDRTLDQALEQVAEKGVYLSGAVKKLLDAMEYDAPYSVWLWESDFSLLQTAFSDFIDCCDTRWRSCR